ncbi:unnamed protein product [Mesocestoides corti]|nr:unnamed protein product [Mesocestoides corti]
MEVLSPKQRLIMAGMKCNSLPKIAKVNVELHQVGTSSPARSEDLTSKLYRNVTQTPSPASERVQRAHSLYTLSAPGNNEYQTNTLVNLLPPTTHTTPVEYEIIDPSEEVAPATPSISVSELASGPGTRASWRIGIVVVCILLAFVLLTVIILGVYFVKR